MLECMLVIERVGIVDRTIRPYTIQSSIKSTRFRCCCSIENHALVANVHVHVAIAMRVVANIGWSSVLPYELIGPLFMHRVPMRM